MELTTNKCEINQFTHVLICGDFNLPDIDWIHCNIWTMNTNANQADGLTP